MSYIGVNCCAIHSLIVGLILKYNEQIYSKGWGCVHEYHEKKFYILENKR